MFSTQKAISLDSIDAEIDKYMDTRGVMRVGLWTLVLALGGGLLWAAYAPLDEGVPTQGVVSISTKRKAVQHLQGGIVSEVRVHEGEQVAKGQVLIALDTANTKANYESIRQHYFSVRALESRLLAEQVGAHRITFHADLIDAKADPFVDQHMATQIELFHSRTDSLNATLRGIEASKAGLSAQIKGSAGMIEQRLSQIKMLDEQLQGIRGLVTEGYAPRNQQMDLERSRADVQASLLDLRAVMSRSQRGIEELEQRAIQQRQEYRKDVDSQLAAVRREVQADAQKLVAATGDLKRTELRSPATGQVVGLVVQTVGAVIQPAQVLMDIVPQDAPLLLETRISPHLADRVHAGLEADVRLSAFAHAPRLVVQGKVLSVSRDLLTDPQTKMSYYLARVEITPEGQKMMGDHRLQPGMPAEVVIKTGERSLLTYLLYPLVRRIAQSMKEV